MRINVLPDGEDDSQLTVIKWVPILYLTDQLRALVYLATKKKKVLLLWMPPHSRLSANAEAFVSSKRNVRVLHHVGG